MGDYPVEGMEYNGSVLAANLLSAQQTLVLSSFEGKYDAVATDFDGKLKVGESLRLDDEDFIMLGSGTAQPGVNLLGLTVPLGEARDLVVLQSSATGKLHFIFPEGSPNELGMIALVVDLRQVGYDMNSTAPLCFGHDTRIATIRGDAAIQDLTVEDVVRTADGGGAQVLAIVELGAHGRSASDQMAVRILAGALGGGLPVQDLFLSLQHRLPVSGTALQLLFGLDQALVPAVALVDLAGIGFAPAPRFYHLICDRHCLVLADGVAAETLLLGDVARENLPGPVSIQIARRTACGARLPLRPCLPILSRREARILLRESRSRGLHLEIGAAPRSVSPLLRRFRRI